ncbi:hypothetical protein [Rhodanobacter soli]|uniref:hypothetical protein n=1 Tax=Rhodanobacter soli TaxID=590609 RepID=UPI0031E0A0A1
MDGSYYQVPNDRRYWVVRAEGGDFLPHFADAGVVAIGHVDQAVSQAPAQVPKNTNWATIHANLVKLREREGQRPRGISSLISQAKAFVNDIKKGDWVICPGGSLLRIGVVTSEAYWDNKPIVLYDRDNRSSIMDFRLRRHVAWGPNIYRGEFSSPLQRSLFANQTVFNVDSHWEAICHTIYPAFSRNDALYLSARISTDGQINNVDVASFLLSLSDIELTIRALNKGLTKSNFDDKLASYSDSGQLSLATKAEFYSPGDIWVQLIGGAGDLFSGSKWMAAVVFAYGMLFGNNKLGFDGVLDLDTRHKIRDLILDRMKKRRVESAISRMDVVLPNKDTTPLESKDPAHKSN